VLPKFVRDKFEGVTRPLGRWILRHVLEFIVLSPAILVNWLYLKLRRKEVLFVGISSSNISGFLQVLEPELRRRMSTEGNLSQLIVLNLSKDANSQIRLMYDRVVKIYGEEAKIRRRIIWWASNLGRFKLKVVDILDAQNDPQWHFGKPVVAFTAEELQRGEDFLSLIGVKPGQKIVCYATRTASYYEGLKKSGTWLVPHNLRNPDERVYFEVMHELSKRGYFVIRMGKDLSTQIPEEYSSHIYDYASRSRSEFLDAFLLHRCNFLVNGGTGIFLFRAIFNLSTVQTDLYRTLKNIFFGDISGFQKVQILADNRFATISETVAMKDKFSHQKFQARLGVALVKNTAEEILAVFNEMEARENGTWVTTPEDEELQQKYWSLITETGHHGGRIGAQFLRDNQDLLR